MFQIICLFFPSFISIKLYNFLNNSFRKTECRETTNWIEFLTSYGTFCVINNTISLFICSWMWKISGSISINGNLSDSYLSKKFLIVAVILAVITAFFAEIIHKYFKLQITVEIVKKEVA